MVSTCVCMRDRAGERAVGVGAELGEEAVVAGVARAAAGFRRRLALRQPEDRVGREPGTVDVDLLPVGERARGRRR